MPQIKVGSANINNFFFKVKFDLLNRAVIFDTTATNYISGGINLVLGIAFSLVDQDGVALATIDFTNPQLPTPATNKIFTLDLSSLNYAFIFQTYSIIGAIKDQNGTVYQTAPVYKKICQPVDFNDSGYVPGVFQVIPDCVNNTLTVKELSLLVYNNLKPITATKTGTLNYPTGTISAVSFANTPFSNNVIYTGQYRINCTTVGEYDFGDDVYIDVAYITKNIFDVTCNNKMSDLACCIVKIQDTYLKNSGTSVGKQAKALLDGITMPLLIGLTKEINGQDASAEAALIKTQLNCDCGTSSLGQNEVSPINPSVYNIVITGVGGTTVPGAVITGSTKTFNVASNVYQIVKGDVGDLAFSIDIDTSVSNTVKYKITFDYAVIAANVLTAIAGNSTLQNQLNSLVTSVANISLAGLNGKCVIDMSLVDYTLIQVINLSTFITSITISGVVHNAPSNLFATDFVGIGNWLNSLSLGSFTVGVSSNTLLIQSLQNSHVVSTMSFTTPNITTQFQSTNKTLVQVLQAIVNYLCNMTALQVALSSNLTLSLIDYNGNPISFNYPAGTSQDNFNLGISQAINNIISRMGSVSGITCDTLKNIFQDAPTAAFGADDRIYGTLNSNCASLTDQQMANLVLAAIGKYSDVKAAFCAVDCTAPTTCPDIAGFATGVQANQAIINTISWSALPNAVQTVSVYYRVTGTQLWTTSTNALQVYPNGNIVTAASYAIPNLTSGQSYDVRVVNNCGGVGFVKQVLIPTISVYQGSYLLSNVLYNLCAAAPFTLYSSLPFGVGTRMYSDIGLTIPATSYLFIAQANAGNIFTMNAGTGDVTGDTLTACSNGQATATLVGTNTGTICAAAISNRYTSGAFAVGKILYTDTSLTNPVTGYSYVVNGLDGHIYTLNTVTGVIGADTAIVCNSYPLSVRILFGPGNVCTTSISTVYISSVNTDIAPGIQLYLDAGLTTPASGLVRKIVKSSGGTVYGLNTSGVVNSPNGQVC